MCVCVYVSGIWHIHKTALSEIHSQLCIYRLAECVHAHCVYTQTLVCVYRLANYVHTYTRKKCVRTWTYVCMHRCADCVHIHTCKMCSYIHTQIVYMHIRLCAYIYIYIYIYTYTHFVRTHINLCAYTDAQNVCIHIHLCAYIDAQTGCAHRHPVLYAHMDTCVYAHSQILCVHKHPNCEHTHADCVKRANYMYIYKECTHWMTSNVCAKFSFRTFLSQSAVQVISSFSACVFVQISHL